MKRWLCNFTGLASRPKNQQDIRGGSQIGRYSVYGHHSQVLSGKSGQKYSQKTLSN